MNLYVCILSHACIIHYFSKYQYRTKACEFYSESYLVDSNHLLTYKRSLRFSDIFRMTSQIKEFICQILFTRSVAGLKSLYLPIHITTATSVKETSSPEILIPTKAHADENESIQWFSQPATPKMDTSAISYKTTDNQTEHNLFEFIATLSEYRMYRFFAHYFVYITSVPGLITNPLTIYLSLTIQPQTSSEVYMLILGMTDLLNFFIRLLILKIGISNDVSWTDWSCKLL